VRDAAPPPSRDPGRPGRVATKYRRKPGGGLVAQQSALRDYQDVTAFLRGLKPVRERLVGLMAKEELRSVPD
jgi:hypothetical protein